MEFDEFVQNMLQLRWKVIEVKCQLVIHKVTSKGQDLRDRMGMIQIVVSNQRVDFIFPVLVKAMDRFDQLGFVDVGLGIGRHLDERVVQRKRGCGSGRHNYI